MLVINYSQHGLQPDLTIMLGGHRMQGMHQMRPARCFSELVCVSSLVLVLLALASADAAADGVPVVLLSDSLQLARRTARIVGGGSSSELGEKPGAARPGPATTATATAKPAMADATSRSTEAKDVDWKKCGGLQAREPTQLSFFMKSQSKNKESAKGGPQGKTAPATGKVVKKTSLNSVAEIGFDIIDVGMGCMKNLAHYESQNATLFKGEAPFVATRLRVLEITNYKTQKYEKKQGGTGKEASMAGPDEDAGIIAVKRLSTCKLAFTQTRDGHLKQLYFTKGDASCMKIKASLVQMFESYFFSQKGEDEYEVTVMQGEKEVPYRVMIFRDRAGAVKQVCRYEYH